MTVIHTPSGEIWRTDFPPEQYYSQPIADCDTDELHRLATGLPRALADGESKVTRLMSEPVTLETLVDISDPATVTSRLPVAVTAQSRAMLEKLEAVLGAGSGAWIHDVTVAAHPGTYPLPLSQARTRVEALEQQIARITAAFARPVSPGRRGAA
jgi:hypothetical protein